MELKNPLYKNIGIHVITALFTVEKGVTKVLLVRRTNEPFKGSWALPSGAMYNNELIKEAALRELKEKTGIVLDDLTSYKMAREIKDKIEDSLQYPGTIKVVVIRETRAEEVAK